MCVPERTAQNFGPRSADGHDRSTDRPTVRPTDRPTARAPGRPPDGTIARLSARPTVRPFDCRAYRPTRHARGLIAGPARCRASKDKLVELLLARAAAEAEDVAAADAQPSAVSASTPGARVRACAPGGSLARLVRVVRAESHRDEA